MLNESNPGIQFSLTGPNGYGGFSNANSSSGLINLPFSGNYVLTVQSSNGQTGAYAFELLKTTKTPLSLNTPYQGTLNGSGQAQLFTVTVPQAGTSLLVNLADNSGVDQNEMFLQLGSAPTRSSYQYRYGNNASANQQVLVAGAAPGTWYILLYSNLVPAASQFSLTATATENYLSEVTPKQVGNIADATLTLTGSGFLNMASVSLVAGNGTLYPLTNLTINSPTQATVIIPANSIPAATYTVRATQADGTTANLVNAFTMLQGGLAHLVTNLAVPSPIPNASPATIYVQFSNTGTIAMPAPLLLLTATDANGQQGAIMTLNPALEFPARKSSDPRSRSATARPCRSWQAVRRPASCSPASR